MQDYRQPPYRQPRSPSIGRWLLVATAIGLVVGISVFSIFYYGVFHNSGSPGNPSVSASPTAATTTVANGSPVPVGNGHCSKDSPYGFTTIHADDQLAAVYRQLNVCWVRYQYHWGVDGNKPGIETSPGVYNWNDIDTAIQTMNKAGIYVDFAIEYAPKWDLVQTCFGTPYLTGPDQMRQFATILATRYDGKHGHGFISSFEIGNEEYDQHFSGSQATSEQCRQAGNYGPILQAGYEAIKAANPNVTVGMFGQWYHNINHIRTFFTDLFSQGYGKYMDYMNFHYYNGGFDPAETRNTVPSFDLWWQTMHQIATQYGYGSLPIWVTEVGWPTHPTNNPNQPVPPDVQAQYLQYVMDEAQKSNGIVKKVFWFTINYGNQGDNIDPPNGPLAAFGVYKQLVQQMPLWS